MWRQSRITTNECQDRVDFCETSACENLNTLLHPRSRPVCVQAKSSSSLVCGTSPRPGGNGDRCVHLGLESMDIVHSPSDSSVEQGPTQNSSRQSNGFTDGTSMGWTAVVPVTVGHFGRLSSQTSNITEDPLPSVRPDSCSPIVEDVSSDDECKQQEFQRRCAISSWYLGEQVLQKGMQAHGKLGLTGVMKGTGVPFQQL